ncbi:hypothetical protein [Afifella sp. YEN Y35]|uniref:hypothetical protein n=1 Tax=Afifella sp. YEN Y35 TaxID=3388337 RepID=UPI0039E0C97F
MGKLHGVDLFVERGPEVGVIIDNISSIINVDKEHFCSGDSEDVLRILKDASPKIWVEYFKTESKTFPLKFDVNAFDKINIEKFVKELAKKLNVRVMIPDEESKDINRMIVYHPDGVRSIGRYWG